MIGTFELHRFCGTEVFELKYAFAVPSFDGAIWSISLEARSNGECLQSLPDTEDLAGSPKAEIKLHLPPGTDLFQLPGLKLSVPLGCDDDQDADLATFYYLEHDCLDDNSVEFLSLRGSALRLRWCGTTTDVNHYDGSKPKTRVNIEGTFTVIASWRDAPG